MKQSAANLATASWSSVCSALALLEREHYKVRGESYKLKPIFSRSLRVALVKQSTYCDLYSEPSATSISQLILSSWHRTGPLGLFTEFNTTFLIVHPEADSECRVWEEKKDYWKNNPVRERDDRFRHEAQKKVAVWSHEVDWSQFDLVIAIENAVPSRITLVYPSVLWATLLEHHKMRPYMSYLSRPPVGYDAFLNLRYGPNPQSFFRRAHVVDWPYNFTRPGALKQMSHSGSNVVPGPQGARTSADKQFTVLLEDNQSAAVKRAFEESSVPYAKGCCSSLADYFAVLLKSSALVFSSPMRPLGGLAMLDAASAGLLLIGDPKMLWNPYLVVPELAVHKPEDAVRVALKLAENDKFKDNMEARQANRLQWFGFTRPLIQLGNLVMKSPRKLSAKQWVSESLQHT